MDLARRVNVSDHDRFLLFDPTKTEAPRGMLHRVVAGVESEFRGIARRFTEREYRRLGILRGELPEVVARDLDTLLNENAVILAVTSVDSPHDIYQLLSVASGDRLPLEERFRCHGFPPIPRTVFGQPIELKTFVSSPILGEDWIPFLLRQLVDFGLLRNVRLSGIWIQAMGEALCRLYGSRYGFQATPYRYFASDVGSTCYVMRTEAKAFQNFIRGGMGNRRGDGLSRRLLSVPVSVDGQRLQQI